MPCFSTPFPVTIPDHTLSQEELLQAVRFSSLAQEEARRIYDSLSVQTENPRAKVLFEEMAEKAAASMNRLNTILAEIESENSVFLTTYAGSSGVPYEKGGSL